jgi:hypothetical protein
MIVSVTVWGLNADCAARLIRGTSTRQHLMMLKFQPRLVQSSSKFVRSSGGGSLTLFAASFSNLPSGSTTDTDGVTMDMEEKGVALSRLSQRVSMAVWAIAKSELDDSPLLKTLKLVKIDEEAVPLVEIDEELQAARADTRSTLLELYVRRGYETADIDKHLSDIVEFEIKHLRPRLPEIVKKAREILNEEWQTHVSPEELEQLKRSFRSTYSGDADERFQRYLRRCCARYYNDPSPYLAPLVLIMQSSGFGKSRLLYELGRTLAGQGVQVSAKKKKKKKVEFDPALLYVCALNSKDSSGFPTATPRLYSFLFESGDIAEQLEVVIEHTCANWQKKEEWLELFGMAPATGAGAQEGAAASTTDTASRKRGPQSIPSFDDTFTEALNSRPRKNLRRSSGSQGKQVQVLVLAIDEAKSLINNRDMHGVSYYQLLRTALATVNAKMSERKLMVFAVLVDTNSQLRHFLPPLSKAYLGTKGSERPFPPFVLTHTMDAIARQRSSPVDYKTSVLTDDSNSDQAWRTLASMGGVPSKRHSVWLEANCSAGWTPVTRRATQPRRPCKASRPSCAVLGCVPRRIRPLRRRSWPTSWLCSTTSTSRTTRTSAAT